MTNQEKPIAGQTKAGIPLGNGCGIWGIIACGGKFAEIIVFEESIFVVNKNYDG